ncbi:MAG: hypothetical protein J0L93_03400 [Deltaproteobacteria bacterium]|nr:hypothetical protein [Deltaproteobacteria bacterium]
MIWRSIYFYLLFQFVFVTAAFAYHRPCAFFVAKLADVGERIVIYERESVLDWLVEWTIELNAFPTHQQMRIVSNHLRILGSGVYAKGRASANDAVFESYLDFNQNVFKKFSEDSRIKNLDPEIRKRILKNLESRINNLLRKNVGLSTP